MIDQVAETWVSDNVRVSTVRLPASFFFGRGDSDDALRWETLIRGGEHDGEGCQYSTEEAAVAEHDLWVMVAKGEITADVIGDLRAITAQGEAS